MEAWYKITTPRKEVREGRSFSPDEFAIAFEQVIAGNAPEDYQNPRKFFSRTCFTRALREHAGMVLRRLAGKTQNTSPVLTLITQFGGGKTHTLTLLYHIAKSGKALLKNQETSDMLSQSELPVVEDVRVAAFVGNAWDPHPGKETPWIDIARQLAGDKGVKALGSAAMKTPPGTKSLLGLFSMANGPVLILMDEVLNFFNRHRDIADQCYAFFDNLNRAMTQTTHGALVISLPRSQVEMTDWDLKWQDKITKVVRRVARDLIANDESEISEVVRRRLFEDLGSDRVRTNMARTYAHWCFERRAQLPPEWTAVDTTTTETKARKFLQDRFEACYPFHPSTLSVFQRKWQALPQYQQTRGTLAMLAQWISMAFREGYEGARREPLITLGSAPLDAPEFRAVILGQLGEQKLLAAIEADISGAQSHARALDADTKGPLRDIHRRVATTILFESSGGQVDKVAHLPEIRFALGEPELDTTTIDNAAFSLEAKSFFLRKVGSDGFMIHHKPTLKKVVSDRRASLDDEKQVYPAMRDVVKAEFGKGASLPMVLFPSDGNDIQDTPRLTLVIMDPTQEWTSNNEMRKIVAEWTKQRGKSPRLYPASLVLCFKKPGRELQDKIELWLAWKRVYQDLAEGFLGDDYDRSDRSNIHAMIKDAEIAARDQVWADYRFVALYDNKEPDDIKAIDLGAGHASSSETLCGRVIASLNSESLLNKSIGSGFLYRNWPPAFKDSGAWPLASLRQSFVNGSLTRLIDPDAVLRDKIPSFVEKGECGLATGLKTDGSYSRIWFKEMLDSSEVSFEKDVFLLKKEEAEKLKERPPVPPITPKPAVPESPIPEPAKDKKVQRLIITGSVLPELWNRFGTKIIPKLRSGENLEINVDFRVTFTQDIAESVKSELCQILDDLNISGKVNIHEESE